MFRKGSRLRKRHIMTLLQNRSAENSILLYLNGHPHDYKCRYTNRSVGFSSVPARQWRRARSETGAWRESGVDMRGMGRALAGNVLAKGRDGSVQASDRAGDARRRVNGRPLLRFGRGAPYGVNSLSEFRPHLCHCMAAPVWPFLP